MWQYFLFMACALTQKWNENMRTQHTTHQTACGKVQVRDAWRIHRGQEKSPVYSALSFMCASGSRQIMQPMKKAQAVYAPEKRENGADL